MFLIDSSRTIHITRGDICCISVSANTVDGTSYTFKQGDIIRLMVSQRKACDKIVLSKTVEVAKESTSVDINLTADDTRFGDVIHKPVDYWYEIELNPDTKPQTVIGYDLEGEKLFMLYPEGSDKQ